MFIIHKYLGLGMKSSVVSLAFLSAVAMGSQSMPVLAKDKDPNTAHCSPKGSRSSLVWNWKSAHLVAQISHTDEKRLDEKNADQKLPIASITKMMTAYLVIEKIKKGEMSPADRIKVSKESLCLPDSDFAVTPLPDNITDISVEDALTQLILLSSNPMADNLAVAVAGNKKKFVAQMNAQAKEWGMTSTHFVNAHGLPIGNRKSEHTTANDLLKMAQALMPMVDDYKHYESRPLEVDGKSLNKEIKPWKREFVESGILFKTATITGCHSLFTIDQQGQSALVTIQLCGQRGTLASTVKGWMEKAKDFYVVQAATTEESIEKSLPLNPPSGP